MANIVCIEDDGDIQVLVSRLLCRNGFSVTVAGDGQTGIDMIANEMPDLVVLDWRLPDMTGGEVLQKLKNADALKVIPVIVLTAEAFKKDEEIAREAGCDDFDTKPLDFERFINKIKNLLVNHI